MAMGRGEGGAYHGRKGVIRGGGGGYTPIPHQWEAGGPGGGVCVCVHARPDCLSALTVCPQQRGCPPLRSALHASLLSRSIPSSSLTDLATRARARAHTTHTQDRPSESPHLLRGPQEPPQKGARATERESERRLACGGSAVAGARPHPQQRGIREGGQGLSLLGTPGTFAVKY